MITPSSQIPADFYKHAALSRQGDSYTFIMTFESLQLVPALLKAVQELGYEKPTPIQLQAIPVVLSGVDLMAAAQTGTGKTGGFALPILHKLSQEPQAKNKKGRVVPRALVLAPTRELAAQIEESFRQLGKHLKLNISVVYGGVSMNPQIQRMQRGVDIVIATPGRLLDLHQQGFADLSQVKTLVLDEADRMLDMGFIVDIRRIIDQLPQERQNLLFSATFSNEIRELAGQLLHEPHTIEVAARNTTVELIEQIAHPVARARKLELLLKLIKEHQWYQVLIFTRTKIAANKVAEVLEKNGIRSTALHGNKSQAARTAALRDFKTARVQALVATDIAARGIDIDQLACVINYDLPNISEDYVHRIGRTGRAGSEGVAISLVTVDEAGFMQQIESLIRRKVEQVVIEDFAPPATEKAQPIVMGRQIIWGGIGKPPSRRDTASVVRAARQHMSQPRSGNGGGSRNGSSAGRGGSGAPSRSRRPDGEAGRPEQGRSERRTERTSESRFAGPRDGAREGGMRDGPREGAPRPNREARRSEGRTDNRGEGRSFSEGAPSESRESRPRRSPAPGASPRARTGAPRPEGSRPAAPRPAGKPRAAAGSKSGFRSDGNSSARPAGRSRRSDA